MNITAIRQQRQQQRLERVWHQQAVQMPVRRQRLPWLPLLGAGVLIGLGLGMAHNWLIKPITPVIEQQRPCNFQLPELTAQDLEPLMPPELARRWAPGGDLHHHLGPQLPKPAPAQPAQAPGGDDRCRR